MENFKELAEKYSILVKKVLKDNEEILIDSFIEYYGKSYSNLIETRYKEITYAWYINWNYMAGARYFLNESDNERILQNFEAFKKHESIWKKLTIFSTSLIGITDESILQDYDINYYLFKCIKKHDVCNFNLYNNKNNRVIVFPFIYDY